ncbi:MAG: phage tail tape measure protein, partial [Clostridia bacterium]|nr:phage tail tape measure protein [Clostridia bacterium]
MAETRDLTVAMSSDTGGFSEGIQQAKNILLELNRTLLDNQSTLKEATRELNNYEKEQRNLQAEMSKSGGDTEENRAKMAQLTAQIQEQRERVASLRTEQTALRGQISRATAALREQTEAARNQAQASNESVSATDRLKNTISEQQNKLESLKEEYSNTVLEQGRTSEQAQNLAGQIAELSAEIENNRQTLENAAYSASDYNDALNDTTEATENQNEANEEASDGFTVLKGAIADLAAEALQAAIDKFGELMTSGKQALNSIQAQTGMTADEMAAMKDQMYDLYGNNFGDSLEDVANVLADVKENINETNPDKIKDIAQNAIALRDTFGTDVSETLRGVNALMTNMGLSAEQAFDYIAKGSQNGLNKTEELSDNLAEYVQLWAQAGFSAEEMFSVLQNGLDSGAYNLDKVNDLVGEISRSIIDGRLESNLDSFSSKTEQVFQAFKNGQATQKDVFDSIINDLNTTGGLFEKLATASETLSALGEDNAMAIIEALNNVNDTYSDVEGTMQSINDIKYDDVGNQLATLGRKFEVDLIQPLVEGVTPALESILTWATDNLPLVASAFTTVTTAVLGYRAALNFETVLATLKNSFAGLTASTKQSAAASAEDAVQKTVETGATQTAKVAQDGLNTSMKANPIILLISLITSLISGIITYASAAQQAKSETDKFKESLDEVRKSAEESVAQTEGKIEVIKTLGDQYEELRTKTNRTADEQKTLDNVAKELAKSLGISAEEIKNQNGEYIELNDTIDKTIEKMQQEAEVNAKKSILQSAYESKEKAKNELSNALKEYREFVEEHTDKDGSFSVSIWEQGKYDELKSKINEWQSAIEACDNEINKASDSLKNSLQAKEDDKNTTSSGAAANRDYAESMNDVSDSADNSAESIESLKAKLESQNTALEENQKAIDETQKSLDKYNQIKQEAIKSGGNNDSNERLKNANIYINSLTSKLDELQAQQKVIKDNISDTEKAVESLEGSVDDALDNIQDSYTQWQNVIKEVNAETNKNGTISIKTLANIQKKYPELIDLVNEYI